MNLVLALFIVVGFGVLLERMKVATSAREVARLAVETVSVLRDSRLDDQAKERVLRQGALRLFGLTGVIVGLSLIAFGAPLGVVWLLDLVGVASFGAVTELLVRVDVLLFAAVLGTGAYLLAGVASRR